MKTNITKPKITKLVLSLSMLLVSFACVKQATSEIPTVKFVVDWANATRITNPELSSNVAVVKLFPQFENGGNPVEIHVMGKDTASATILPGPYKIHLYNNYTDQITASGDTYETAIVEVLSNDTLMKSLPQLMSLAVGSNQSSVVIGNSGASIQEVKLTPVSFSKNMRFQITTQKFPTIESVSATLSGIASKVELSTKNLSVAKSVQYSTWTSTDGTIFNSSGAEVLGLYTSEVPVVLYFSITVSNPTYVLEQSLDITDTVKSLVGDEVEVKISVVYEPEIRITGVTITQWLDGKLLDVEVS